MVSFVCHAFNGATIGTKVIPAHREGFKELLATAVSNHDPAGDRVPGQHFIMLPGEATNMVSAGVGRHTHDTRDYLVALHRGQAGMYLRRSLAAEVEKVAVVVYTREAYLANPDDDMTDGEILSLEESDANHVIVAVLAFAGPQSPMNQRTWVHNIAGNNEEYSPKVIGAALMDTLIREGREGDVYSMSSSLAYEDGARAAIEYLKKEAQGIDKYHSEWCTVVDDPE